MNDAVYKFKRYEDASLEYTGINKHEEDDIGLWDTVLNYQDYHNLRVAQLLRLLGIVPIWIPTLNTRGR